MIDVTIPLNSMTEKRRRALREYALSTGKPLAAIALESLERTADRLVLSAPDPAPQSADHPEMGIVPLSCSDQEQAERQGNHPR